MAQSRAHMKMDVLYVLPGAAEGKPEQVFYTSDGVGRTFFDTVEEARDETGIDKVVHVSDIEY